MLRDLPSEHRLKEMLDNPRAEKPEYRQQVLSKYKGNSLGEVGKYEIIRRAADNIKNLKPEAERLYYLAAELGLSKIDNGSGQQEQGGEVRLKNMEVSSNEHARVPRFERNTISPHYIRELKAEELRTITHPTSADGLQLGEALLHLSLYDSINGEKTFEYVCYGEQTLLEVVTQFYCLIARLEGKQQAHLNSYCLIEDNFYFQGSQARKKIEEIVAFSNQNQEGR